MAEPKEDVKKPGHIDNLEPDQEGKLKAIWKLFLDATKDVDIAEVGSSRGANTDPDPSSSNSSTEATADAGGKDAAKKQAKDDDAKEKQAEAEEAKALAQLLEKHGAEGLKRGFWQYVIGEDPDALMLRFLRARSWDAEKAFHMLASTLKWRLDTDVAGIIAMGEEGLCKLPGVKKNLALGKCYYHGTDRQGRPVVYAHVKNHKASDQDQDEMEKFLVYNMETSRTLQPIRAAQETASVVVDMTGFGLSNMDWDTATTVIKVFQSYYPETLGHAIIWNSPTIFSAAWKIIKPMLDPVVREKITFASRASEIEKVIDPKHLPKSFDGQSTWTYRFRGPQEGENKHMDDEEQRTKRSKAYFTACKNFEQATAQWSGTTSADASSSSDGGSAKSSDRRGKVLKELVVRMIDYDPFYRGKTQFSRDGTQVGDGTVKWTYDHGREEEFGESVQEWAEDAGIEEPTERPINGNDANNIELSSDEDTVSSTSNSESDPLDDPHHHHHSAVTVGFAKVGDRLANGFSKLTPGPSLHKKKKAEREERHRAHESRRQAKLEAKRKRIEAERLKQEELEEDRLQREQEEEEQVNASYASYLYRVGSLGLAAGDKVADYVPAVLGGNYLKKMTSPTTQADVEAEA